MIKIRTVSLSDLDRCYEIESDSYGPEGATKDRIKKRIEEYPSGFLVITVNDRIEGFINSGCSNKDDLADEEIKAMIGHDPEGKNLIVFSVVVDRSMRRKQLATKLLTAFLEFSESVNKSVLLICKEELITLYEKFGFRLIGPSKSNHGGIQWYEMILER